MAHTFPKSICPFITSWTPLNLQKVFTPLQFTSPLFLFRYRSKQTTQLHYYRQADCVLNHVDLFLLGIFLHIECVFFTFCLPEEAHRFVDCLDLAIFALKHWLHAHNQQTPLTISLVRDRKLQPISELGSKVAAGSRPGQPIGALCSAWTGTWWPLFNASISACVWHSGMISDRQIRAKVEISSD